MEPQKPLLRPSFSVSDTTSKSDDSRLQQTLAFKLALIQLAKRKPVPTITDSKGNAESIKSSTHAKKDCDQIDRHQRHQQRQLAALHLESGGEKKRLVGVDLNRLQPYVSYFPLERAHDAAVGYLLRVYERAVSRTRTRRRWSQLTPIPFMLNKLWPF